MSMQRFASLRRLVMIAALAAAASASAQSQDAPRSIEQTLTAAQQDRRGLTLYVNGQTIGGAVVRVEAGQWVELRNQQFGRIIVRLDRIDGVALP
jgi:murein endopeptidase